MGPHLPALAVCGAPGSGKSVLARALAVRAGAALLDQDSLTEPLVEVVGGLMVELGRVQPAAASDLSHPELAALTRAARYRVLLAAAEDCLGAGVPVVLVAPFTAERSDPVAWDGVAGRLRAAGGAPALVWAAVPPAVLVERLRRRALPRDAAKLADPVRHLATLDVGPPASPHVAVDVSAPSASRDGAWDGVLDGVLEAARAGDVGLTSS